MGTIRDLYGDAVEDNDEIKTHGYGRYFGL